MSIRRRKYLLSKKSKCFYYKGLEHIYTVESYIPHYGECKWDWGSYLGLSVLMLYFLHVFVWTPSIQGTGTTYRAPLILKYLLPGRGFALINHASSGHQVFYGQFLVITRCWQFLCILDSDFLYAISVLYFFILLDLYLLCV